MRIAVLFDNFGPYHVARLSAAARMCELLGIEVAGRSAEYDWAPVREATGFEREVLVKAATSTSVKRKVLAERVDEVLSSFRPEAVAVPGWSSLAAFLALRWCIRRRIPAILMSESQAIDQSRRPLKEWIKSRYLLACHSALVGGRSHREYLIQLGMAEDRVFLGYDVVDNNHFARDAEAARADAAGLREKLCLPRKYFLASSRFIPKKNIPLLLRAYGRYCAEDRTKPWEFVLLGDGPLRPEIEGLTTTLGIRSKVHLAGFRQYDELPAYYGLAGAFVHASTTEQWGLVVNEAMAAGLPVLVSNRCGCAHELVRNRENGFQFDPADEAALARLMAEIARDPAGQEAMGRRSSQMIRDWGPDRFARGLLEAAECALRVGPPPRRWLNGLILRLLAAR